MRFEMDMKNPKLTMRDVFSKIAVDDKTVKVGNADCYKLTCTPKEKYGDLKPVIYYVSAKDFLIREMVSVTPTRMGDIKTVSLFSNFQAIDKQIVPMHITIKQANITMEVTVKKVENNIEVKDSEFEKSSLDKI
jgi:outer membrane lipoprotein-sorting protein